MLWAWAWVTDLYWFVLFIGCLFFQTLPKAFGTTRVSRGYVTQLIRSIMARWDGPSFDREDVTYCQQIWTYKCSDTFQFSNKTYQTESPSQQGVGNVGRWPLGVASKVVVYGNLNYGCNVWVWYWYWYLFLFSRNAWKFRSRNSHNSETMTSKM